MLLFPARKESAKEKQLKEEEKILESVAEGRGKEQKIFFFQTALVLGKMVLMLQKMAKLG